MQKLDLNGQWTLHLTEGDYKGSAIAATVPGSVYNDLLTEGLMEDPYYRDNELKAIKIMDSDFVYARDFELPKEIADCDKVLLHCDGLDTIAFIEVNDKEVGYADNMHRTWEFCIKEHVHVGINTLKITFKSPTKYIRKKDEEYHIGGSTDSMRGFPQIRKAHCMFGWDWGPRLPDAGIWRSINIIGIKEARINDLRIDQFHNNGTCELSFVSQIEYLKMTDLSLDITVTTPDGDILRPADGKSLTIQNPKLWWPNGLGSQPLYTVKAELKNSAGIVLDHCEKRIGLRTMTMVREKDKWGESFAHSVNGLQFFAMGADYIPEDNILSRITPVRTRRLLEQCVLANFNVIRVWGGGFYPHDEFFDICDELGLVVWQDFMFACANYDLTPEFDISIKEEIKDNLKRIRHHASLGLLCGNNEMEMFQDFGEFEGTLRAKADYIKMFEYIIPALTREYAPQSFYWPASPSSGGSFFKPNDSDSGDQHYWDVWHGNKPYSEYRKFFFRYVSEFGFQSFPCLKTIESFALPEDRNIFSYVMEMHQRNAAANGKIMNYMSQTFLYPNDFATLLYASQLLQAEAIKYGTEHFRRNRGRCMGAVYWQLNDCWPVASWASIDYFNRWKALHYFAKRFFAPVLLSCEEVGEMTQRPSIVGEPMDIETSVRFSLANETWNSVDGVIHYALRDTNANILREGKINVHADKFSSTWLDKIVLDGIDVHEHYVSYELFMKGERISGSTVLFCPPKHFRFADPHLEYEIQGDTITISASAYAKSVEIDSPDSDFVLSDNYFDMNAGEVKVKVLEGEAKKLKLRSVFDIR